MDSRELLRPVIGLVKQAGRDLLKLQPKAKRIAEARKDFVTNADQESHYRIIRGLSELTPEIPVYSEEGKEDINKVGLLFWAVDPLDGTINYFHQNDFWGVSIALVENKQSNLGVVYLPGFNQLVAVLMDRDIVVGENIILRVREDTQLSEAQIWTDWTEGPKESTFKIFSRLAEISFKPQIRLCATASLLAVATGKIAGYIHPGPKPEDIAAACLAVEKAGGRVTDLDGRPWSPFSESIVATNSLLHNPLLEALSK